MVHGQQVRSNRGISKEEIETITDDKNVKDNDSLEEKKLMEEWEAHMSDFIPEDITTMVMGPRTEAVNKVIVNQLCIDFL